MQCCLLNPINSIQGRRPRGRLGAVPLTFEVGGTAHASVPPIFWEVYYMYSVVGCARKHEQSKKRCFLVRNGSYTTFNIVNIRKIMGKKGHEKFLSWKRKFFRKNLIQKSWSAKKVFRPPKLGARSPPLTPLHSYWFSMMSSNVW